MSNCPTAVDETTAPLISIIIPTRNRAAVLEQALRAIVSQTFRDFEVIVIDDGSDAATRAAYAGVWHLLDERFRLYPAGIDGIHGIGPSTTRNLGIAKARGSILAFCDDDDLWTAVDHLELVASTFAARPALDMYIANQTGVSAKGVEIADWMSRLRTALVQHAGAGIVTVEDLCNAGGFAHLNILAVRKSVVLEAGGFWERVGYEEDRDFFWRSADCCDLIFFNPRIIGQHNIPDPKRMDNQSTQHSMVERWLLSSLVCQHIAASVSHPAIATLARRYEGDLLRKLSMHFNEHSTSGRAIDFGRRALAARFSLKWALYLTALGFRAMFTKKVK